MVRVQPGLIARRAAEERFAFTFRRACHWASSGNPAIATDYLLRALGTRRNHLGALTLGLELGFRVGQPELSEKCASAIHRLMLRKQWEAAVSPELPNDAASAVDDPSAEASSLMQPAPQPPWMQESDPVAALLRSAASVVLQENEGAVAHSHASSSSATPDDVQTLMAGSHVNSYRREQLSVTEIGPFDELQRAATVLQREASARADTAGKNGKPLGRSEAQAPLLFEVRNASASPNGRGLVALRRIAAGTVLVEEEAFLSVPMRGDACDCCTARLTSAVSGSDLSARRAAKPPSGATVTCTCGTTFCSTGCQRQAMHSYHAPACGNVEYAAWEEEMRRLVSGVEPGRDNGDSRVALSLLAVGRLCLMATTQQVHPRSLPGIADLRGVLSYASGTALSNTGATTVRLADALRQSHLYLEDVLSLLAVCRCNEVLAESGLLLFRLLSLVNHSCVPNCGLVLGRTPTSRRLVTLSEVRMGDELVIDYNARLHSGQLTFRQRQALLDERGVRCFCSRCATMQ